MKLPPDAPPETPRDEYTREHLQKIAAMVNEQLPQNWGFVILAFPFGSEPGRMNYISNGRREDIVKVMLEFIAKTRDTFGQHV
jgi:hypothetical protein